MLFAEYTEVSKKLVLSFAKVDGAWAVFDVANGIVFKGADGRFLSADAIAADPHAEDARVNFELAQQLGVERAAGHRVVNRGGNPCGSIIWELKHTKSWKDEWLPKLKADQRVAKSEIAIIVSSTMPDDVKTFAFVSTPAGESETQAAPAK